MHLQHFCFSVHDRLFEKETNIILYRFSDNDNNKRRIEEQHRRFG